MTPKGISRLRPFLPFLTAALSLVLVTSAFAQSATPTLTLQPGQTGDVVCAPGSTPMSAQPLSPANNTGYAVSCQAVPSPAPAPAPAPAPTINETPICPDTDLTRWHPLVQQDSAGTVTCTYGHEHGMNPHQLDPLFGPLPLANEISYPWATPHENETGNHKHMVYKWIEGQNLPTGNAPDGSHRSVTAFRLLTHIDGNMGAPTRYHSYWLQAQLTDPATGRVGEIQIGGWIDFGHLTVGPGHTVVPLPTDPPAACVLNGDSRQEGVLGGPEQPNSVWYGTNSRNSTGAPSACDDYYYDPAVGVQYNIGTNDFGPVDPANPSVMHLYPDRENHTQTVVGTDSMTLHLPPELAQNGVINFTGHVDRHGHVVPEVAGQAPGVDYIPLVIKNAEPGAYGSNFRAMGDVAYDGDVPGPHGERGYYVQYPQ